MSWEAFLTGTEVKTEWNPIGQVLALFLPVVFTLLLHW